MDVCCLPVAWTFWRILFMLSIQHFIHPRPVFGESERSTSKNKSPSNGPQDTKCQFPRKRLETFLLNFSELRRLSLNKPTHVVSSGIKAVSALQVQMRNINFLETGFTGRTDFIVVRYSVTNNGLLSRFRFQGYVIKVNCI
jgi:hypothetical protein